MSTASPDIAALRAEIEAKVRAELAGNSMLQVHLPHPTGTAAYDAEHNPKVIKVQVTVAARAIPGGGAGEAYPGMAAAHIFWPNGTTERMVTERQYADLLKEPGLHVINMTELERKAREDAERALEMQTAPSPSKDEAKPDKRK